MYLPDYHRQPGMEACFGLIAAHPLGAWVAATPQGLVSNHLPFVLDRSRGAQGVLLGHVSRANDAWAALSEARQSVVMFQGPQAYITPNWYPGKAEHGRVVPTWNYSVVHVHGTARAVHDRAWILDVLAKLTDANEAGQPQPWTLADAPRDFIDRLAEAVVGIEISIEAIAGKLKASQDEELPDRKGTVAGLRSLNSGNAGALADLVEAQLAGW